jgi:signal transduction histidine kinase
MKLLWPFRLQRRFFGLICLVAMAMGLFFVGVLYFHLQQIVTQEARHRAQLLLEQANSVQGYVQDELRPRMYAEKAGREFIIEAMSSSYVSRKVMQDVAQNRDVIYRRVAINSRNPDFDPNELEMRMIRYFRENPAADLWQRKLRRGEEGKEYFYCARPVVFDSSCMRCHGEPEDAPDRIVERYGAKRGFHYKPGEVAGVVSVGFPIQRTVNMIQGATLSYLSLYLAGIAAFFGVVQVFFQRLVAGKLKRLLEVMRRKLPDGSNGARYAGNGFASEGRGDEMEEAISALEGMADDLGRARVKLEDYAQNLEDKVRDRTASLELEAGERRKDITLFLNILQALHTSRNSEELVREIMRLVGHRFDAETTTYYCTNVSDRVFSWPESERIPALPERCMEHVLEGEVVYSGRDVFIPVSSTEQVWGVLHLRVKDDTSLLRTSEQVLLALGQQLGVALENMKAFFDLMHSKRLLESIFEGISDPLMLISGRTDILLANTGAQEIFPQGGENVRELKELLGGYSPEQGHAEGILGQAHESGLPQEREAILAKGRSFKISLYPLTAADRRSPNLAVCSIRENTAEKRMLAKLQRTEKLSAVGKLASGLAHEINNPLGTILCYVRLLQKSLPPEASGQDDLEVIERQAKRAHGIVREMLDYARPKSEQTAICDLNELVRRNVALFSVQAEKKKVMLSRDPAEDLPRIAADESAVEQILSNLILNAIDAAGEGGWVRVVTSFSAEAGKAYLEVRDSGPGIAEDQKHQIFDPFYSTKDVGQGTGLGLTVVYGLVQEHGAEIEVGTETGAVFSIGFCVEE